MCSIRLFLVQVMHVLRVMLPRLKGPSSEVLGFYSRSLSHFWKRHINDDPYQIGSLYSPVRIGSSKGGACLQWPLDRVQVAITSRVRNLKHVKPSVDCLFHHPAELLQLHCLDRFLCYPILVCQ